MSRQHNSIDRNLDALLQNRPVAASHDFAARTLQRLHNEKNADARLDELLASHPIEAPANLASTIVWRMRRRNALAWVASLAASVAVVISVASVFMQPKPLQDNLAAQEAQPAPQATAGIAESSFPTPTQAELLELVDGLEGAEPLLDPQVVEALDSAHPAINE